jgi:hypothetical protein
MKPLCVAVPLLAGLNLRADVAPAPVTDPAQVTQHLKAVLTQPQYTETPDAMVTPHLEDLLSIWFRQLGARLGEFKYATRMPAFESMLMTVLVALALAVLIYVMVRLTRRRLRIDPEAAPAAAPISVPRAPEFYDAEIAQAVESGDWRGAWLAGWRQFLSRLEQRSLVTPDRTRTNREYLRQLRQKPVPASALQLLTGAVDTYDRFIYGRVAIAESDWTAFRRRLDEAALLLHLGERKIT